MESLSPASFMLPKEQTNEKVVIISPNNGGVGKILIREDTILTNLQGCAGCGRAQFSCAGIKNQWSALCWGKRTGKRYFCVVSFLALTFVLSFIGTILFCFSNPINDVILSNMVIRNNTMAFKLWQYPTVQPIMKVHIFNYTNWRNVRAGTAKKLIVEDVGPYTYAQQIERVNIKFQGNLLSFQEKNSFKYLPELSAGSQIDSVNVPNLPLLSAFSKAISLRLPDIGMRSLNHVLGWANNHDAFLQLPVHGFLWGYDDNIIEVTKAMLSLAGMLKFDRFGFLVTKNGTTADHLTINTGVDDITKMNIIERIDGKEHLSFWGNPECNSIESSDGTIFPPSILNKKEPIYIYFSNLCRRVPFIYDSEIETDDGVTLLRYKMPLNVFDDPDHNPFNQCFCDIATGHCPPRGIANVSACVMGAPALASFPHFYLGDKRLAEEIEGLHPYNVYESYIDIHPKLGIVLGGKSSIQINIQVKKHPTFSALEFLKEDLILPVAYLEFSVGELPESFRSLIYHGTFSSAAAQLALTWGCITALILSGICLTLLFVRRKRKPCATLKKVPAEENMLNQTNNCNNK